jgi:hypothetical protein
MERRTQRHFGGQRADRTRDLQRDLHRRGLELDRCPGVHEYAAPKVFSSIFTEFNAGNIDDKSGLHFTNGVAKFQNNIFWNFASRQSPALLAECQPVGADQFGNNLFNGPDADSVSRTTILPSAWIRVPGGRSGANQSHQRAR